MPRQDRMCRPQQSCPAQQRRKTGDRAYLRRMSPGGRSGERRRRRRRGLTGANRGKSPIGQNSKHVHACTDLPWRKSVSPCSGMHGEPGQCHRRHHAQKKLRPRASWFSAIHSQESAQCAHEIGPAATYSRRAHSALVRCRSNAPAGSQARSHRGDPRRTAARYAIREQRSSADDSRTQSPRRASGRKPTAQAQGFGAEAIAQDRNGYKHHAPSSFVEAIRAPKRFARRGALQPSREEDPCGRAPSQLKARVTRSIFPPPAASRRPVFVFGSRIGCLSAPRRRAPPAARQPSPRAGAPNALGQRFHASAGSAPALQRSESSGRSSAPTVCG